MNKLREKIVETVESLLETKEFKNEILKYCKNELKSYLQDTAIDEVLSQKNMDRVYDKIEYSVLKMFNINEK